MGECVVREAGAQMRSCETLHQMGLVADTDAGGGGKTWCLMSVRVLVLD